MLGVLKKRSNILGHFRYPVAVLYGIAGSDKTFDAQNTDNLCDQQESSANKVSNNDKMSNNEKRLNKRVRKQSF